MATPQADNYAAPLGTPLARFGAVAAADAVPPTFGGVIAVSSVTSTSYTLAWPAATDNLAVTAYERSLDGGASWLDVGNVVSLGVSGRTPSTTDQVRVRARDAAGNRSVALSAAVSLLAGSIATYRDHAAALLQGSPFPQLASRLPLGDPNSAFNENYEKWGPTWQRVSLHTDWMWTTLGGDWLDAALVANGATAWATTPVPVGVAGATSNHTLDVTTAIQFVQTNDRWAAFAIRQTNAPRKLLTNFWPDALLRPRIEVTYTDATTGTLACLTCASVGSSTAIPNTTALSISLGGGTLGCLVEFERPAKAVAAATMHVSCTDLQWSGNPTDLRVAGVLNPPTRGAVTPGGVAQGAGIGAMDSGLIADPNSICVQRYLDGTAQTDFVAASFTNLADNEYSPEIFGGGADTGRLPYLHAGKWLNGNGGDGRNLTLVDSAYAGEGFAPLAPGLGALRTHIAAHSPLPNDGDVVGNTGALGAHASIALPADRIGLQQHVRIRYYQRVHMSSTLGPLTPANRRHYWQVENSAARFADRSGKGGIGVSHDTMFGGFSGSSGGRMGWQMRDSWYLCDAGLGGPDEGGVTFGYHLYDFLSNNPAGHRYGQGDGGMGERYGQLGGFGGKFEFDRWYLIEKEIKLNTVGTVAYPAYVADGLLRTWVDGVLVYEQTGMVMRQTPVYANAAYPPGGAYITPMRDLGIRNVILNFFYGGQTWPTEAYTQFYTGLVVMDGSAGYIGPMKPP